MGALLPLSFNFYPRPPRGGRLPFPGSGLPGRNFYPRPPRGGRLDNGVKADAATKFLSTPSARRATPVLSLRPQCQRKFLSTPSARRATVVWRLILSHKQFLSTPSARRATCLDLQGFKAGNVISIHALREEGDIRCARSRCVIPAISIHALREEGDVVERATAVSLMQFLSTPSARRATIALSHHCGGS